MNIAEEYMKRKGKDSTFFKPVISILYTRKLVGIDKAVPLIRDHMDKNHKILNYTDYDCDLLR